MTGTAPAKERRANRGLGPLETECAMGRAALLAVEISRDRAVRVIHYRDVLPSGFVTQAIHHDEPSRCIPHLQGALNETKAAGLASRSIKLREYASVGL